MALHTFIHNDLHEISSWVRSIHLRLNTHIQNTQKQIPKKNPHKNKKINKKNFPHLPFFPISVNSKSNDPKHTAQISWVILDLLLHTEFTFNLIALHSKYFPASEHLSPTQVQTLSFLASTNVLAHQLISLTLSYLFPNIATRVILLRYRGWYCSVTQNLLVAYYVTDDKMS